MTLKQIAPLHLCNQQIAHQQFQKPKELIQHMVAIQAQDYLAALWAIGLRLPGQLCENDIELSISKGKIIRTWPMRGTLHFVPAEDTRWMLNLLTPRVIKTSAGRHKELELNKEQFTKSRNLIEKVLQKEVQLTRNDLYRKLEENGISTKGQRGYHILWYLAQNAIICFGPRHGKQHTFVLFDEWIPKHRTLHGEEALAELALRYIKSRGPVTEYDFAWWTGLKVSLARKAFHLVEEYFEKEEINNQTYRFPDFPKTNTDKSIDIHLLPSFDEMICGYKDRSAILASEYEKSVILRNGIIKSMIIKEGSVVGTWKRTLKKEKVLIETEWFNKLSKKDQPSFIQACEQYAGFLGKKADFHM
jgi:hypothetical protein